MASKDDAMWQDVRYPPVVTADGEPTRLYPYQCNICCLFLTAGIEALEEHVAEHRSKLRARLEAMQHEEGAEAAGHMWDYLGEPPAAPGVPMHGATQQHQHHLPTHSHHVDTQQAAWYSANANRAGNWPVAHAGAIASATGTLSAMPPLQVGITGTATQEQHFETAHTLQDVYTTCASQGAHYGAGSSGSTIGRMVYTGAGVTSAYTSPSDSQVGGRGDGPGGDGVVTELQGSAYRSAAPYIQPSTVDGHVDHMYLSSGENVVDGRTVMYYGPSYGTVTESFSSQRGYRQQVPVQQFYLNPTYGQPEVQMQPVAKRPRLLDAAVSAPPTTPRSSFTDPMHSDLQLEPIDMQGSLQSHLPQHGNKVGAYAEPDTTPIESNACLPLPTKVEGQWNQGDPSRMFSPNETVDVTTVSEPPTATIVPTMEEHLGMKGLRSTEGPGDSPQPPPAPAPTPAGTPTPNGGANSGETSALNTGGSIGCSPCFERSDGCLHMDPSSSGQADASHPVAGMQQQQQESQPWIKFLGHCGEAANKQHEPLYAAETANEMPERATFPMKTEPGQHEFSTPAVNTDTVVVDEMDKMNQVKQDGEHSEAMDKFSVDQEIEQTNDKLKSAEDTSDVEKTEAEEIIEAILSNSCVKVTEGERTSSDDTKLRQLADDSRGEPENDERSVATEKLPKRPSRGPIQEDAGSFDVGVEPQQRHNEETQ